MFQPQHATAPPADSAHVWASPAATATWPPAATAPGTVDWLLPFEPQHATTPPADSAHVWLSRTARAT